LAKETKPFTIWSRRALGVLCILSTAAWGQTYFCKDAAGKSAIQDLPCALAEPSGPALAPLPREYCRYENSLVRLAREPAACVFSFVPGDVEAALISMGSEPLRLRRFDFKIQETRDAEGALVVERESYAFASRDKQTQVSLVGNLERPSEDSDEAAASCCGKVYSGTLTVRGATGTRSYPVRYLRGVAEQEENTRGPRRAKKPRRWRRRPHRSVGKSQDRKPHRA
jgi:hypothetical protein